MTWLRRAAPLLLMLCAATACGVTGEELPTYRYRLTVEVNTPEGLRSGSSVIEVRTRRFGDDALPDMRGDRRQIEGEAVAVDLGRRGTLFAVLRNRAGASWPEDVVESVLPPLEQGVRPQDEQFQAVLDLRGVHPLPRFRGTGAARVDNYPLLVHFGDPRHPETVELVDPERLDASFGPGVSLHRITVERTDAPVTHAIRSRLPFLRETMPAGSVDRTFAGTAVSDAVGLARYHFERNF